MTAVAPTVTVVAPSLAGVANTVTIVTSEPSVKLLAPLLNTTINAPSAPGGTVTIVAPTEPSINATIVSGGLETVTVGPPIGSTVVTGPETEDGPVIGEVVVTFAAPPGATGGAGPEGPPGPIGLPGPPGSTDLPPVLDGGNF